MDKNTKEAFETIEKALRPEVTKEQLFMLVQHLHEAIECLIDDESEIESPEEDATENGEEEIDVENPEMDKMDGQVKTDPKTLESISEEKTLQEDTETEEEPKIKKSIWDGTFIK